MVCHASRPSSSPRKYEESHYKRVSDRARALCDEKYISAQFGGSIQNAVWKQPGKTLFPAGHLFIVLTFLRRFFSLSFAFPSPLPTVPVSPRMVLKLGLFLGTSGICDIFTNCKGAARGELMTYLRGALKPRGS